MANKNNEILEKLLSFYRKEKFFDERLGEGLLHNSCEHCKECWKRIDKKYKEASDWNYFSLPFIGKEYKGELVCVALNVHKGGGRNLQEMCIRGYNAFKADKKPHDNDIYGYKYDPGVIESFKEGQRRVNFKDGMKEAVKKGHLEKPYPGTPLWFCIAVYSKIILEKKFNPGMADNLEELAKTYERIIFMDAIKCSPGTNQSRPTGEMKKFCPEHIFFRELEIMRPDNLLIMQKSTAKLLWNKYKPKGAKNDFPGTGRDFDYRQVEIGGKSVSLLYVIHPTAHAKNHDGSTRQGFRTGIFEEFAADFLNKR